MFVVLHMLSSRTVFFKSFENTSRISVAEHFLLSSKKELYMSGITDPLSSANPCFASISSTSQRSENWSRQNTKSNSVGSPNLVPSAELPVGKSVHFILGSSLPMFLQMTLTNSVIHVLMS